MKASSNLKQRIAKLQKDIGDLPETMKQRVARLSGRDLQAYFRYINDLARWKADHPGVDIYDGMINYSDYPVIKNKAVYEAVNGSPPTDFSEVKTAGGAIRVYSRMLGPGR